MKLKAPEFNKNTLPHYFAALILLVMFVLLFLPFWSYIAADGSPASTSINELVWFPHRQTALQNVLTEAIGTKFSINEIIFPPIFMMILSIVGLFFCALKQKGKLASIFPALAGIVGIWCVTAHPVYQLGSFWPFLLVLSTLALGCSVWVYTQKFHPNKG